MQFDEKFRKFQVTRELAFEAQEQNAFLQRAPAANPPHLMVPTRVRVLRPFYVGGKLVGVDKIVELPAHDARSLSSLKKCEILE